MPRLVFFDENATPQHVTTVTGPSVNEGPFLASGRTDFVVNPDLSALSGIPQRYWKHSGGAIVAMDAGEQAAVDAALAAQAAAQQAAQIANIRAAAKDLIGGDFGQFTLFMRAFADIMKDEFNIVRERDRDWQTAVAAATSLADLKVRVAALPTLNDRTLIQLRNALNAVVDSTTVDNP